MPRHPDRSGEIATALTRDGYNFALRSAGQPLTTKTDLYVADTLGELGLFLRLADVVVMGGSFSAALGLRVVGGHNPLEPARLGKPIVTGLDVSNWNNVAVVLLKAGAMKMVVSPGDLPAVIEPLLADPAVAKAMGERARRAAADAGSGLDTLWREIEPLLPPAPVRRGRK